MANACGLMALAFRWVRISNWLAYVRIHT